MDNAKKAREIATEANAIGSTPVCPVCGIGQYDAYDAALIALDSKQAEVEALEATNKDLAMQFDALRDERDALQQRVDDLIELDSRRMELEGFADWSFKVSNYARNEHTGQEPSESVLFRMLDNPPDLDLSIKCLRQAQSLQGKE